MINSISVTNHRGETLDMDLRNPWRSGLAISGIDGLYPPEANINSTELSTMDGSVYNSARIVKRNVVLRFIVLENTTIEQARHILYKHFPIKNQVKLTIRTDERELYTIGYVETNNVEIFSKMQTASVSLICPDPYLYSVGEVVTPLMDTVGGFEFPFSNELGTSSLTFGELTAVGPVDIIYRGEVSVGVDIVINIFGELGNIRLYNMTTDQEIIIDATKVASITGGSIQSGDIIHICTIQGKKSITLTRSGVEYNILASISREAGWIRLDPGDNIIVYSAIGIQNAQIYLKNRNVYEGV